MGFKYELLHHAMFSTYFKVSCRTVVT